jgi:hypothetical protein
MLWIISKSYGWSSPHAAVLKGELFKITDEKPSPIWQTTLLEKTSSSGVGYKEARDVLFSSSAAKGSLLRLKSWQAFDGGKFVLRGK